MVDNLISMTLALVFDHGGNFDGDPVSDDKAALLHQLLRHGPLLKHCIAKLHQLAGVFHLNRILRVIHQTCVAMTNSW